MQRGSMSKATMVLLVQWPSMKTLFQRLARFCQELRHPLRKASCTGRRSWCIHSPKKFSTLEDRQHVGFERCFLYRWSVGGVETRGKSSGVDGAKGGKEPLWSVEAINGDGRETLQAQFDHRTGRASDTVKKTFENISSQKVLWRFWRCHQNLMEKCRNCVISWHYFSGKARQF